MKKYLLLMASTLIASISLAQKHDQREHGAHVHGSAELGIAFEKAIGKIEFKSSADSIVGFEHKAVKSADRSKLEASLKTFEAKLFEMIVFEKNLQCVFTKETLEPIYESESHSDIVGRFSVTCARSPAGTTLTFNFQKTFPNLKDIDTQIIVDELQKSAEIKSNGQKIELK